ncbi:MAG: TetR/AcrR family transcriptional regulator [bacterium]|nr:TetR/AcrR family transcriptional regulator [bacterium]
MTVADPTSLKPRQLRSRRSLDRLLAASEEVISEVGFEKASVASICRRAGLTSGAFYSRFAGKKELVGALVERFAAEARVVIDELDVPPASLQMTIRQFVAGLVSFYRRRRPLVRALAACAHVDEVGRASMRELHGATVDYLCELLLIRERDFSTPQPHATARLGVLTALATVMEMVVEQRMLPAEAYPLTDEQLTEELAQLLDAYFTKT